MLALLLLFVAPGHAVLKEKDLARTLGVLRAELAADYEKQQMFMQMYEQQGAMQHQQLVSYMNRCEQIGLMLYSQSMDNTFDMAYACQQATNLYREVNAKGGTSNKFHAYGKRIARLQRDIERYDALIASLKSMPPVDKADEEVLTESDSILLQAIDSLASRIDSLAEAGDTIPPMPISRQQEAEENMNHEPLYLTGQQLEDREACLEYAQTLRDNMQQFLETMENESTYYKSVQEKVERLNAFAQARYKILQDNIFTHGGSNYFTILSNLSRYIAQAQRAVSNKYKPFEGHTSQYSEWRGASVLFITIFVLLYLSLAMLITYVVLRWLMPKHWLGTDNKVRRQMLTLVIGTALFAIVVMVLRSFMPTDSVKMGARLIINTAWLMEVIFLSLYIRLKGRDMLHATLIYLPLLMLSFIVVMFRILLIPDSVLNLLFPPILLGFTLWQLWLARRHRQHLPMLDMVYTYVTNIVMVVSCLAAWIGYTLLAVQIMIWWTFQLAAITTITCFYDLMEMFEHRYMLHKIGGSGNTDEAIKKSLLHEMEQGEYITKTWIYDFVKRTIVPILAVGSVLFSIYWAAEIFEMTSVCQKAFFTNFINQKDLIQVSLFKLCQVAALWFIFGYFNYAIRSFYVSYRKKTAAQDDVLNLTLAKNVIAILTWGLYFIIVLVILNVPKSGISIVTAGLATGLGFAMQDLIENFFYGLSLMTGRLRVGDYIECDGITGKVESITYQSTQVITGDGCVIAFLNKALFSKNFKNMTRNHSYEMISIPVGVAYGTNVDAVRRMLIEALTPICQEKNAAEQPLTDPERPIVVRFADFGASSVDLKVFIWMLVEEKYGLTARVKEAIYNTLNENHIEIPFPQSDIHIIQ
ncbi:MAG: mechanosensitive ion channel [Bacteroidaceae bacterium]|nr:mechanosensitive ion channel [Bacteroidaceae bacterium]